jgi:hypothetical protein
MIFVVEVICLWKMDSAIQDGLWSFSDSFLPLSNFIIKVTWDGILADFGNAICWDAP